MYEYIPEVMTFKECKELLKVGKNTLLDLIHTGQIQAFKVGRIFLMILPVIPYSMLLIKSILAFSYLLRTLSSKSFGFTVPLYQLFDSK